MMLPLLLLTQYTLRSILGWLIPSGMVTGPTCNYPLSKNILCCITLQSQEKMSKSDPNSAIFMEDRLA
jgi:hypothetical protein